MGVVIMGVIVVLLVVAILKSCLAVPFRTFSGPVALVP